MPFSRAKTAEIELRINRGPEVEDAVARLCGGGIVMPNDKAVNVHYRCGASTRTSSFKDLALAKRRKKADLREGH
jgi:hypothetical protein